MAVSPACICIRALISIFAGRDSTGNRSNDDDDNNSSHKHITDACWFDPVIIIYESGSISNQALQRERRDGEEREYEDDDGCRQSTLNI